MSGRRAVGVIEQPTVMSVGAAEAVSADLSVSLSPLLRWLKLFGVSLSTDSLPNSRRRNVYGGLWLLFSLASFVTLFICISTEATEVASDYGLGHFTAILSANVCVDYGNWLLHIVGAHVALLYLSGPRWRRLWKALCDLGNLVRLDAEDRRELRRFCWIGIGYTSVTTLGYVIHSAYHVDGSNSFLRSASYLTSSAMYLYPTSGMLLFCILGRVVTLHYRSVARQILHLSSDQGDANALGPSLSRWQQSYLMVSRCADWLNDAFGIVLLLDVTTNFVSIIVQSIYIFVGLTDHQLELVSMSAIYTILNLFHLWIIGFTADRIRHEARNVSRALRELQVSREPGDWPPHLLEVQRLMAQIVRTPAKFCAVGFFDISQQIIPKVMGTTLTYFIVFYQFHSKQRTP